jgi:hypothetical protein
MRFFCTRGYQCVNGGERCDERIQSQQAIGDGLIVTLKHEAQGTDQADDHGERFPTKIAKPHVG